MTVNAITGSDTISLDCKAANLSSRVLLDFADGDNGNLTFQNDLWTAKTGKNGNTLYAFNETGKQCELTLRIIRGSQDDKDLNNVNTIAKQDPASFTLIGCEFVKKIGDGNGNVTRDIYNLQGGVIKKQMDVKSNVEGDTEQSLTIYTLVFSSGTRTLA